MVRAAETGIGLSVTEAWPYFAHVEHDELDRFPLAPILHPTHVVTKMQNSNGQVTDMSMTLKEKSALLDRTLSQLGSALVAYSGGTDSAFLAWSAHRVLGDNMLAVIADSASLPRTELSAAVDFTKTHKIPTYILHTDELDNADYQRNDSRRCFHCKDELFSRMEKERKRLAYRHIAYGMNLDDKGEFRPGQLAAEQHHAVAPLFTAQLRKSEIRTLARAAELSIAEKPASACLASRIEYGRPVTMESLSQVELAEEILHSLGFLSGSGAPPRRPRTH